MSKPERRPFFRAGYTLIELIIVMAIISVLVAIAVPMNQKSLLRTKESLLKNNLFTLRTVIDEYTFDKQKAPQTLDDLVAQGYLRNVPVDPFTKSAETWLLVASEDPDHPGLRDVHSGSPDAGSDGSPFVSW